LPVQLSAESYDAGRRAASEPAPARDRDLVAV